MSKFEYKLLTKNTDKDDVFFEFFCGDLWIRSDVSFHEDLDIIYDTIIEPSLEYISKITKFKWILNYNIPLLNQLKNTSVFDYKPIEDNKHYICPLEYKNHELFICADLLRNPPETNINLINKFREVKKIIFDGIHTMGGFLEADIDNDEYIQKKLNNPRWVTEMIFAEKDEIKDLLEIKKNIKKSIKFEFNCDASDLSILKKSGLI